MEYVSVTHSYCSHSQTFGNAIPPWRQLFCTFTSSCHWNWNSLVISCLKYSNLSRELSSIPARLCHAWLTTTSFSCLAGPEGVISDNPFCTSSDVSCNHSQFQKLSPRMMHMLCSIRQVLTNSDTFLSCTSILFNNIRHLFLSISNARLMHILVELWTKFQLYFSRVSPSLWLLKRANIQGQQG